MFSLFASILPLCLIPIQETQEGIRQYIHCLNNETKIEHVIQWEPLVTEHFKEEDVEIKLKRFFNPHDVNPKAEIISVIQESRDIAFGKTAKVSQWNSGVNISEIFDIKLPVVGFGPGDEKFSHTPIEHVPVDQVIKAAKSYTVLAEKICVQMKDKDA